MVAAKQLNDTQIQPISRPYLLTFTWMDSFLMPVAAAELNM
jgi:hypothetical protein